MLAPCRSIPSGLVERAGIDQADFDDSGTVGVGTAVVLGAGQDVEVPYRVPPGRASYQ